MYEKQRCDANDVGPSGATFCYALLLCLLLTEHFWTRSRGHFAVSLFLAYFQRITTMHGLTALNADKFTIEQLVFLDIDLYTRRKSRGDQSNHKGTFEKAYQTVMIAA